MAQLVTPPVAAASFISMLNGFLTPPALKFLTNITNALNGSTTPTGAAQNVLGNGITITKGVGSPEGVIAGSNGDLYVSSTGGAGATLYYKQSGTPGSKSGWAPIA